MMMKKKDILSMLFCTALLSACQQKKIGQETVNYSVMTIKKGEVTLTESYSASVQGRQDIEIYPQISGTTNYHKRVKPYKKKSNKTG